MIDLSKTYIRAKVDDKWQSLSLQELIDNEHNDVVFEWVLEKLNKSMMVTLTPESLFDFVQMLEKFNLPVVQVK